MGKLIYKGWIVKKVYKIYVDREQVDDIIAKNYEEAYLEARKLYPNNYLRIFQDFPYTKIQTEV